jgi:hypothetical protein
MAIKSIILRKLLQNIDFDGLLMNLSVNSNVNQIMQTNSIQKNGFAQSILRVGCGGDDDDDADNSS